jgi:hypothetical protein
MAHKKGFNDYKIMGDTTIIYIKQRNDKIHEVLIDTEDLERIIALNLRWGVCWYKKIKSYYCRATRYKFLHLYLHKFILGTDSCVDFPIDHINHNTLDNRKSNLRMVSKFDNIKNRSGKNSNNKSGYRNVCLVDGWWIVQIQINGKNTRLGKFEDVHEAGKFAEEMRKKYYGEFAGKS